MVSFPPRFSSMNERDLSKKPPKEESRYGYLEASQFEFTARSTWILQRDSNGWDKVNRSTQILISCLTPSTGTR